jgi:hypothetical protein
VVVILSAAMTSAGIDWAKLLDIVNSLAGPLVTAVAVLAAVLFFRADRRLHTLLLLVGCVLIFAQRVTHVVAWLPGLGYFERAGHVLPGQIQAYNNFTVLLNLVAWLLFVFGLLMVAVVRFRATTRKVEPAMAGAA